MIDAESYTPNYFQTQLYFHIPYLHMNSHLYYRSHAYHLNVACCIYLTSCSADLVLSIPARYLKSTTEGGLMIGDEVLTNYLKWMAYNIQYMLGPQVLP